MIRFFIIISFLFFNGCSTFKKEVVECPKLISPKKAAEIVVNSESNLPVYLGFRGVKKFCFKDGNDIQMELSVNIRAIRNDTTKEDYVPVNISVVSIDLNEKEFDRDEFNYSQFLLKGSKKVDRATTFELKVPAGGQVLLGIK
jgi:hypothetical protein|tara:strand:- start:60 stop:488 length:429 start_codon:yes stop_codon:yes gene_type:complete